MEKLVGVEKANKNWWEEFTRIFKENNNNKDYDINNMIIEDIYNAILTVLNNFKSQNTAKTIFNNVIKIFEAANIALFNNNDNVNQLINLMSEKYKIFARNIDENKKFQKQTEEQKINIDKLKFYNIVINKEYDYKLEYSNKLREIREQYKINTLEYVILTLYIFYH